MSGAAAFGDSQTKGLIWNQTQRALNHLCQSKFFYVLLERVLIFDLKQVNPYLTSAEIRKKAQERLAAKITADTRVIVAHSLGTVVAYESLCAHPTWPVTTFVSLGSPLGIRNFFFDRLTPPPDANLGGHWPAGLMRWINVADQGDTAAVQKQLAPRFGVACATFWSAAPTSTMSPDISPRRKPEKRLRRDCKIDVGKPARSDGTERKIHAGAVFPSSR